MWYVLFLQILNLHQNKQKYKSKQKKDFTSRNI